MEEYAKDIIDSLHENKTLESLTLCKIGCNGTQFIENVFIDSTTEWCTLKQINLSWGSNAKGSILLNRQLKPTSYGDDGLYLSIIYDNHHESLSEVINLSNKNIDDDAVNVIALGLYDNAKVEKLDISNNTISLNGLTKLSKCTENAMPLHYVDLSGNTSSPWGLYCAIITHCCVNSLTLCGHEGMKDYVKDIICSLQVNAKLQSLILLTSRNNVGKQRCDDMVVTKKSTKEPQNILAIDGKMYSGIANNERLLSISINICDVISECLSETISLSNSNINDDLVCLITFGLHNNTTVIKLDLSYNNIERDGAVAIADCLKHNHTLQELNISHNKINDYGAVAISKHINSLQKFDISHNRITNIGAIAIDKSLEHNNTLKELNLSNNFLYVSTHDLFKYVMYTKSLEYIDFSGNKPSPWGVYYTIIRHCCVKSLTLCGDEGMEEYAKDITDSLHENKTLESLTLCKIAYIGTKFIENVFIDSTTEWCTLKQINLSWGSNAKGSILLNKQLKPTSYGDDGLYLSIIYDNHHESLSEAINLSNKNIDDDAVNVIALGLYDNAKVEKLDISNNTISLNGLTRLSKCIENAMPLHYVDLSGNKSSPWGLYCAIITHCCVNSLTLCGHEGMKDYVKDIISSLQVNAKLQSLILLTSRNNVGKQRCDDMVVTKKSTKEPQNILAIDGKMHFGTANNERLLSISINICDVISECLPETISLSNSNINDDLVCLITFGLYNNTTVIKLDLSYNNIKRDGVVAIADCLKYNNTLQELNISHNKINDNGAVAINKHILNSLQKFDISHNRITNTGAIAIDKSLECNNTLKELNLSGNSLYGSTRDLFEYIILTKSLEYIDLSGNGPSPWGVYYTVIRHCCVKSLTLCGDEGMEEYAKDITNSLHENKTLESLTLCKIGYIGTQFIENVFIDSTTEWCTLKQINLSWESNAKGSILLNRQLKPTSYGDDGLYLSIIYDNHHESLSEAINLSNKNIDDDAVNVIALGLYDNAKVEKLDISNNKISLNGLTKLSNYIKLAVSLKYVDLSGNKSSPWGVYCVILRYTQVKSLALCGDEGIKEYVKEIVANIQANSAFQSLTLYKIGKLGLQSINDVLIQDTTLKELQMSWMSEGRGVTQRKLSRKFGRADLHEVDINILYDADGEHSSETINMSNKGINDDAVYLISFGLHNNTIIQSLDLSCNNITDNGVVAITGCLRNNYSLHKLNLSKNEISYKGAKKIAEAIRVNKGLHKLDISQNPIGDYGVMDIVDSLKHNNTLLELNLSKSGITDECISKSIIEVIKVNTTLRKLNLSYNNISDNEMIVLSTYLKKNYTLKELDLSNTNVSRESLLVIGQAMYKTGEPTFY